MTTLGQSLRTRHVTMITIGGIIGAGLFVGSSTSIATIGPACIVSYGLAGLVILLVMRMLSELAAANPGTGAFTEFARLGLGEWAGFTSGWLYWYFWVMVVPIEAIAGGGILHQWVAVPIWALALALLAVMTGINLLSTRSFGEFEFWFSSIKVAAIVGFIAIAGGYVLGIGAPHPGFGNLVSHNGFAPFGPLSVVAGVTSVIFSFVGAEIVTIAAVESAEPARSIARLTSSVAVRILLFYMLSITLIVAVVPWDAIRPGISPFARALGTIGIAGAETIMNLVVLTAVLSCLNSGLYVTSRVLFGLASKGDAPAWLIALNGRRVPARAILAGAAFGYLAIGLSVVSPTVVFSFLVSASGAIALVNYLLVALAQIRLRQAMERDAPERLAIRMWFFPYASWGVVGVITAVLAAMAATPGLRSQFVASLCTVLVVVALFLLVRRRIKLPATSKSFLVLFFKKGLLPSSLIAVATTTPRLVPLRDVIIDYTVHPGDRPELSVQVSVQAGGAHLRITSPDLPTAFVIDRPAHQATILLPMLKLYATAGIRGEDPEETVLRGARFERHGRGVIAGLACTDWTAVSPRGHASACITEDGVILRGMAYDAHRLLGTVLASNVRYGALSPDLFRRPEGFHNAGTLPIDGFSGGAR